MTRIFTILAVLFWATQLAAGSSTPYQSERITARLITAEQGVAPGASAISAALEVKLAKGWKTYWKSPGQVGYPPELDWGRSHNIDQAEFFWPTPTRFEAFDIENYGYETAVTYPIQINLINAGQDVDLIADINLLVCADLCVPEQFSLVLSLFGGEAGVDTDAAALIAEAISGLPDEDSPDLSVTQAYIDPSREALLVEIASDAVLRAPQVFPDLGPSAAFGAPKFTIGTDRKTALAQLPILASPETLPALELVVADGARSVSVFPELTTEPPSMPGRGLIMILLTAFLGGLILNVMPCVLPVLSIKITSALKAQDQSRARIATGFFASALGVLAFMWLLAAILWAVRFSGGQIGWGIQFQSPLFLAVMSVIVITFAANMMGLFEIALPQSWTTSLAAADGRPGLIGDFSTGALAAILATPCSAPFLGTAVSFALARGGVEIFAIFTALGLGLAAPYILVALRPGLVQALPKPGRWMLVVKWVMGGLLALTALWLLSVLASVAGWGVAFGVLALSGVALVALGTMNGQGQRMIVALCLIGAVALPILVTPPQRAEVADENWTPFAEDVIAARVAQGEVVFVDVTADWCLSCKANKRLVLDRDDVQAALKTENIVTMRADWTRPDPVILAYLQANGRFGIPFNIIYGPGAPHGIALPEILTPGSVISALEEAASG